MEGGSADNMQMVGMSDDNGVIRPQGRWCLVLAASRGQTA